MIIEIPATPAISSLQTSEVNFVFSSIFMRLPLLKEKKLFDKYFLLTSFEKTEWR